MPGSDPVQCATCGWTGQSSDVEEATDGASCPVCGEELPISH